MGASKRVKAFAGTFYFGVNFMAQYDGRVLIDSGIETKNIRKDVNEIKKELELLEDSQKSFIEAGGSKESPVYKDRAREIQKLQEAMVSLKSAQENAELSETHWNQLKIDADEYAKSLKELESQGKFFGDEDYDKVYLAWKNATDAVKSYKSGLNQQSAKVQEVLREEEIEQNHLAEIKKNAKVSDEKMVSLLERKKALTRELKELEAADVTEGYQEYDKTYIALENIKNAVKEYRAELEKQTESGQARAAEEAAKALEKQEAAQRKVEEQAEKNLQKENARIQKTLENEARLQAKQEAEAAQEQRLTLIRENAVVGCQRIVEVVERRKNLLQEIADMEKEDISYGYQQYDSAQQELALLNKEISNYSNNVGKVKESYKKLGDTAKKSLEKASKVTEKSSKNLLGISTGFKNILKYALGTQSLLAIFNKLKTVIKEGFDNLYNSSEKFKSSVDNLKASAATLKNSIAAAFAPIAEMAIPYIQKLMDYISKLLGMVAQFTAAVTGQKTYTKAVKQTTEALENETKAGNKQLSSLDKLNNLSSQSGTDSGTGTMFEEVPVDSKVLGLLDNLKTYFKDVSEYAKELKNIFMQGFWNSLGDWQSKWENIKQSAGLIKDTIIEIATDPNVLNSADKFAESFAYVMGTTAGLFSNIGLTIAQNLTGGMSKFLSSKKEDIKQYLIDMFDIGAEINNMVAEFNTTLSYVFSAFGGENGQQLTANLLAVVWDVFSGVTELAGRLFRDITSRITQPFIDNKDSFREALDGFLGVAAEVAGTLEESLEETFDKLLSVYDEHFKPFFDDVTQGISELTGEFLDFWNGSVQPILDEWAEKFDTLWKEHVQPVINELGEVLGAFADLFRAIWNNQIKPVFDWIINNLLPVLLPVFKQIAEYAGDQLSVLMDVIGDVLAFFKNFINMITALINGDWAEAWESLKGIVDNIVELLKTVISNFIDNVTGKFSKLFSLFDKTNSMAGGSSSSSTSSARSLSAPATKSLYVASPVAESLSNMEIPGYATGQVIPRSMKQHLAILGDNNRETEVVSPISTIKQAVKEVAMELGALGTDNSGDIIIQIDSREVFRVMRKQAQQYKKQTGSPAFQ